MAITRSWRSGPPATLPRTLQNPNYPAYPLPAPGPGPEYVENWKPIYDSTTIANFDWPGRPGNIISRATANKTSRRNDIQQATIAGAGTLIPLIYGRRRIGGRIAGIQVDQGKLHVIFVW